MSTAIVDARGWQNTLDLKTGEKTVVAGPAVEMVKNVLQKHPYPGDMDERSNRWVSDTALDLIDKYNPRFVFLAYAAQYFSSRYTPMTQQMRKEMIAHAFLEADYFINASGFIPVVVGTGGMTPLVGLVDVTRLDGLAVCTHWSARYSGLYEPSTEDLKFLKGHPHVEYVVSRDEITGLFQGTPQQSIRVPEYLILAREGYAFKAISGLMKTPVMIPSFNTHIPVYAPGHIVGSITGIRRVLENMLADAKIALIIMEGVGLNEFPWPRVSCENGTGWHYYEPGEAQWLTIASGRHRFLDYPTGYKHFEEREISRSYPFSGHFKSVPEDTIAKEFPGKSIAVGNRSMLIHMVTGADICVECFARNLYNQGTMAVIHRDDK